MEKLLDLPVEIYLARMRKTKQDALTKLGINPMDGSQQMVEAIWLRNYYNHQIDRKKATDAANGELYLTHYPVFFTIEIKCGEYEFTARMVELVEIGTVARHYLIHNVLKNFWESESWEDDDDVADPVYYFCNDEISARLGEIREITWDEYKVLEKYL